MSYIAKTMAPGETLTLRVKMHWIWHANTLVGGWLIWVVGRIPVWFSTEPGAGIDLIASTFKWIAIIYIVVRTIRYLTTEMAITSDRVVFKEGWLARKTVELQTQGIEGVEVKQTLTGRMFNFGTVNVTGRGGADVIFPDVADPLEIRQKLLASKGPA